MRLDKFLSDSGVGTRREVKRLIREGKVTVNGVVVTSPSYKVRGSDTVEVEGKRITRPEKVYILFYKPAGYVTSTEDPRSETIMEFLPPLKGLFPVGRLDKDAEGLLLVTTDGEFAHKVTSPKHGVEKEYSVEVEGEITEEKLARLKEGVLLKDGFLAKAKAVKRENERTLKVVITEGKYHQVKRMMAAVGLRTVRLKRTRIGGLTLPEDMSPGEYRFLSEEEVKRVFEGSSEEEDPPST